MALINGRSYDWSMIEVNFSNIAGGVIVGITNIKYDRDRKIENNYGVGSEPNSKGYGNVTYTASMTIDMNSIQQLQALATNGLLENLGLFDVVISYNHPDSESIVVDTIEGCIFSNQGVDVSQDDTKIEKEHNLNPSHITYGDSSLAV